MMHIQVVGDATVDLAAISVNLLEIMGYDDERAAIDKMHGLATWLIRKLVDVTIKQARLNKCDIRHVECKYKPDANKDELLTMLANCLRELARDADVPAVEVRNLEGVLQ